MNKEIIINFYELCEEYRNNLNINLRDFGSESEYLKFWVPSTDLKKSFCNLIDAMKESNKLNFKVFLNSKLNSVLDEKFLYKIESSIGKINIVNNNNDLHLDIKINIENYDEDFNTQYAPILKVNKKNIKENVEFVETNKEEINKNYIKEIVKISNLKDKNIEKNKILINTHLKVRQNILFTKEIEDLKICCIINKDNKTIVDSFHSVIYEGPKKILLDYFSNYLIGVHIIEAADHGSIYLEYCFRPCENKFSGGIIMSEYGGLIFSKISKIMRSILKDFKKDNDFINYVNKNYPKVGEKWKNLSSNEKRVIIEEQIYFFVNKYKIPFSELKFVGIEKNIRVFVEIGELINSETKYLMLFEDELKKIEKRIEVFTTEIKDSNKLRWKNAPKQSKIVNI